MKRLFIILMIAFLSGCTTTLQPKLTGNHYQHFKCGFEIDIPSGWKVTKEKPQWFPSELHDAPAELTLTNNNETASIVISCDTLPLEIFKPIRPNNRVYDTAIRDGYTKPLRENTNKKFEDEKGALKSDRRVKSYDYSEIFSSMDDLAWQITSEIEKGEGIDFIARLYFYPYNTDTVYFVISMACLKSSLSPAMTAWERTVASLKRDIDK